MILPNLSTTSAFIETPLQEPLRLARGLLRDTCSTHFAAHHFAKKSHFPLSFLNIFPIQESNLTMSAPEFPKGLSLSALRNLLLPLIRWASKPSAEADLESIFGPRLDWASAFKCLNAFRSGDFSFLPSVRSLSASDMPGLWGGYSRETREIYISADCPEELLSAVLIEEIGHFLDQELCSEETPGEEGAHFAAVVLGLPLEAASIDDSLATIFLQGSQILVEAARKARGSAKSKASQKSSGKKRGKSKKGTGPGYAEVGGGSSNPKLPTNIVYATEVGVRIPQKAPGDRLIGSRGNDTFAVISQDVKIEDPNGGTDTVESSVTFDLTNYSIVENLVLSDSGVGNGFSTLIWPSPTISINGTGNLKANVITGNSGNNKLDGGIDSAIDTLRGGAGNDTYVLRDTLDQIVEAAGGGTDTIQTTQSTFSMANYANVENLAYSGTGTGVAFTGNGGNNSITGTSGADSLDGGEGVDTLNGGLGNDTYIIDNNDDAIIDQAGLDTVVTRLSRYSLTNDSGVENLVHGLSSSATLVGNNLANSIVGGAGNDSLLGGEGSDTITGGLGIDTLLGGGGNDVYFLDDSDKIIEVSDSLVGGIDTVFSSTNHTLASGVENLQLGLTSIGLPASTGTVADNDIPNSTLTGAIIYPGGGALISQVDPSNDEDWVRVELRSGVAYTFELKGNGSGSGTLRDPVLTLRDSLGSAFLTNDDGGIGLDSKITYTPTLSGNYYLSSRSFASSSTGTYTLSVVGVIDLNGVGNSLNNSIVGSLGRNLLRGLDGDDTLDGGGGGQDTFEGGKGNDLLIGWSPEDRVVEAANSGIDTVISASQADLFIRDIYLGRNDLLSIEGFIFLGNTDIEIVGNNLNNFIQSSGVSNETFAGGTGNDTILAGDGDDLIDAGGSFDYTYNNSILVVNLTDAQASSGIDSLIGGDGSDTFIVDNSLDKVIEDAGASGIDVVQALVNYTLAENSEVEELVAASAQATQLTGNQFDNKIESYRFNSLSSTLLGLAGSDVLVSHDGNDLLDGGNDNDLLQGGDGNDTLKGGAGSDYLQGGLGDDLYILEDAEDFIEENLNSGIDAVQASADYTLDLNVENLIIVGSASVKGTGNELDNFISGNSVANTLSGLAGADILSGLEGNDYLDGGVGADSLSGGDGDDTFTGGTTLSGLNFVDDGSADTLRGGNGNDLFLIYSRQDNADGELGTDTVYTAINNFDTRNLFENFYLGDGDFDSSINEGFGGFSDTIDLKGFGDNQNNLIVGNAGGNVLDGAGGADTLVGGIGNDTIIVDDVNDWVFDVDGNNVVIFYSDSVSTFNGIESFIGSTLRLEVIGNPTSGNDTLTGRLISDTISGLQGNDSISGLGANDSLSGNDGDDTLDGGEGFDTLVGGEGNDFFVSGGGEDTFIGGNGDDVYQINVLSPDKIIEDQLGGGIDTILTDDNLSLAPKTSGFVSADDQNPYLFIENLVYDENRIGVEVKGVSLTGNTRSNSIQGGTGADTLDGGISFIIDQGDTLNGGTGNDLYIIRNRYDWIIEDTLTGSLNDIDTVYTYINFDPLDDQLFNTTVTKNTSFASKDIQSFARLDNFVFMDVASAPIRGVGNAKNNSFTGNAEHNVILGLAGDDTILGNAGNDSLYGDADTAFSLTRNSTLAGYDSLAGEYPYNPGDYDVSSLALSDQELLIGASFPMAGRDYLVGGDGDDLLSGNGGDDILVGGSGGDSLIGGTGVDSMVGGEGSDAYYIDNELDVMVELAGEGIDTVLSNGVNIHLLQDHIENIVLYEGVTTAAGTLRFAVGNSADNVISISQWNAFSSNPVTLTGGVTLSGGDGNDKIYGYYNSPTVAKDRYADDYLVGGSGNDILDGGKGADTMEGGLGNDTIYVDRTLENGDTDYDKIWEFNYEGDPANGGQDWVISSVDIDLKDIYTDAGLFTTQLEYVENGMFIENLKGSGHIFGNWLNNSLIGGNGNDSIRGEAGNDSLYGGKGNDSLDGGDGTNILDAGSLPDDPNANTEIDWVTGSPTIKNTDGIGYYRNNTDITGNSYGSKSYVITNALPGVAARESNPQLTYFDTVFQKITTAAASYVTKNIDAAQATTIGLTQGAGTALFVSINPGLAGINPLDDLIAYKPNTTFTL